VCEVVDHLERIDHRFSVGRWLAVNKQIILPKLAQEDVEVLRVPLR